MENAIDFILGTQTNTNQFIGTITDSIHTITRACMKECGSVRKHDKSLSTGDKDLLTFEQFTRNKFVNNNTAFGFIYLLASSSLSPIVEKNVLDFIFRVHLCVSVDSIHIVLLVNGN
jgi:hypothetical protein